MLYYATMYLRLLFYTKNNENGTSKIIFLRTKKNETKARL